jgi:hypothetical protein
MGIVFTVRVCVRVVLYNIVVPCNLSYLYKSVRCLNNNTTFLHLQTLANGEKAEKVERDCVSTAR